MCPGAGWELWTRRSMDTDVTAPHELRAAAVSHALARLLREQGQPCPFIHSSFLSASDYGAALMYPCPGQVGWAGSG